ncbi:MAG: type II toxin-antitoxin system RelB/DinJ family antitoxin [Lachnospiraceae bacterium]|nr:type II toxin-antitoxin system RelB/DinJ family antitoxin [Lachnospiraceae bacterium]
MAVKTANVNSRMSIDIKEQAEAILNRLGIPRSVAIDIYYRQIIAHNGIPFSLTLPSTVPARDEMTKEQFDRMMETGLKQAKEDDSFDVDEVFSELERR